MAIDVDGIAVLRAIADHPLAFPDVAAEINEAARTFVIKQLKSKTTTLERLRLMHQAIGGEALLLILDGLADSASSALVKKLDKENPDIKTASSDWLRRRIAELASGAAEPASRPSKLATSKPKASRKGKAAAPTAEEKAIAAALRDKGMNLAAARALWLETGESTFIRILGGLSETHTLSLGKKLDKDHPDMVTGSTEWRRQRIADLARGIAEPTFKNILESKAMAAKRARAEVK